MKTALAIMIAATLLLWGYISYRNVISLNKDVNNSWNELQTLLDQQNDTILQMISYAEINSNSVDQQAKNVADALELWERSLTTDNLAEKISAETAVSSTFAAFLSGVNGDTMLSGSARLKELKNNLLEQDEEISKKQESYDQLAEEYNKRVLGFTGRLAMRYDGVPFNIPLFEKLATDDIKAPARPPAEPQVIEVPSAPAKVETPPPQPVPQVKVQATPPPSTGGTEAPVQARESYVEPPSAIQPPLQGASGTLQPNPPSQIAPNLREEPPQPPVTPKAPATPRP